MSHKFHFKSKRTNYYVTSTINDRVGNVIATRNGANSVPENSVLNVNPTAMPGIVTITGVSGLYVSVNGSAVNTKLTWSNQVYTWQIKDTVQWTDYIIPGNGLDLYWFDSFAIGAYVVVKPGRDVIPPDSEWFLTNAD